jgi:CheY-like chemotaxis protein
VDADLTRLAQVFTNLLSNSAKYTEKGGRIWLTVEILGDETVVSVRDNGIGITAEHMPHLFEMFSQATPALERAGGGLGIGLALARGVVELHGGSLEARSEGLGRGSELIVRLPRLPATAAPGQEQPSGEEKVTRQSPRQRVLVADDNRDSAESLSLLLELAGCEVFTVHDGLAAVEAAAARQPDAALLDIGMPQLNGYEVARRIRQQPGGERMLLVAITGWGQEDDKQRARDAGFDHHLTKPVDFVDLNRLLEVAQARQRLAPE